MSETSNHRLPPVAATIASWLMLALVVLLPQSLAAADWLKLGRDLLQGGSSASGPSPGSLSDNEIGAGLKDALKVGTGRVVDQLGQTDGFNTDPLIHIPLPDRFEKVRSVLAAVGKSELLDDLELKLNRAAEAATPQAKQLFWDSIYAMGIDDVRSIYDGPEDAATRYFREKMSQPLAEAMSPVVAESMSQVGAVQAYDAVMGQYRAIPFVPDVKADLTAYVVGKGVDGIFLYLAREEAAIRQNPARRTTEILQTVFGGN